ncbi:MAG: GEVED domain-containing protein [Tannerella sp.]|jgi:endo-beta-N-acetylglucosaminidase D|nr:GEVED domain-containing protein [Tannerella sp.]
MKKISYYMWITAVFMLSALTGFSQNTLYVNWGTQEPDSMLLWFKDGVPSDLSKLTDLEFRRSHVRPKPVIVNQAQQLDPSIDPRRSIFFNCPIGSNSSFTGLPSGVFDEDVFSMWQYVKIHGNWSNSWFIAPAAYSDAAHKHGTAVLSSWFFPWAHHYVAGKTKEEDPLSYRVELITKKDAQGNFIYAEPFINLLMFLGVDGINYNYESYTDAATEDLQAFHARLYEVAKEKGFDTFHIGWYDMVRNDGTLGRDASLSAGNDFWYYQYDPASDTGKTASDAFMLDYGWGKTQLDNTVNYANLIQAPNGALDVYAGCWIVKLQQAWLSLDQTKGVSICLWGEHQMNRIFQHRSGLDETLIQQNYQDRLDWVFTGGNRNPNPATRLPITTSINDIANNNQLKTFHGISRYVTERSTVQGALPFATSFVLGNGTFYNHNGVKTHDTWYNLAAQDMVPTYRWLVLDASGNTATHINASFTFADAWLGGSALALTGEVKTTPADIHLYRSDLTAGATPKARLVYKVENANAGENSNLRLILKKNNAATWTEYSLGNIAVKDGWNETELSLAGFDATDKITAIGLRVQGAAAKQDYKALIGELKLYNDTRTTVEAPKDLAVEYLNECATMMDLKLVWSMSDENKTRLVYNDEVNVDHFELFIQEGTDDPKQIAHTSSWAHFIAKVNLTPGLENFKIGVRAVSTDLTTASAITWQTVERDPSAAPCNTDIYCMAKNDMTLDAAEEAVAVRYFESASTEGAITNLNLTGGEASAEGYIGYLDESMLITVEPGSAFTFKAKGTDPLQWCRYFMYADWNGNRNFDVDTEIIAQGGIVDKGDTTVIKLNIPITVPEDARPGFTRIRVRYADAWRAHPGACGLATHGYTADFLVKVLGDIPDGLEDVQTEAPAFHPNPVTGNVTFQNVEKVRIYTLTGALVGVYTDATVNLSHLERGTYIVKMERGGVTKADYLVKK